MFYLRFRTRLFLWGRSIQEVNKEVHAGLCFLPCQTMDASVKGQGIADGELIVQSQVLWDINETVNSLQTNPSLDKTWVSVHTGLRHLGHVSQVMCLRSHKLSGDFKLCTATTTGNTRSVLVLRRSGLHTQDLLHHVRSPIWYPLWQ